MSKLKNAGSSRQRGLGSTYVVRVSMLLALTSCNALVDTSIDQCKTAADCENKGGGLCHENVCITVDCTTTPECNERLGEDSYCRPDTNQCVKLLTDRCFKVAPARVLENDHVVLAGFMAPVQEDEPDRGYGIPLMQGAEFALSEIESNVNGLPALGGIEQRHLAMLVCGHGNTEAGEHIEVAKHLVERVGVPVILGPAFSGVTLDVFDDVARQSDVLVLSGSATSPAITDADDNGLLWRTAPSDVEQAEVLKWLLPLVEGHLLASGIADPRLAVTIKGDAAGTGLRDEAYKQNGPDAAPAMQPDNVVQYKSPAESGEYASAYAQLIGDRDPLPNIIVALGTDEFVRELMPRIEQNWPADGPERPWYLLPEGDRTDQILEYASKHPEFRLNERVLGTAPGARRYDGYDNFQTAYGAIYRNPDGSEAKPGNLAEFMYDAVYLLGYAIAHTNKAAPTGPELAAALSNMTCKDEGTRTLKAAAMQFRSGYGAAWEQGCLDFDGVSGALDFSDAGEAKTDIGLWCLPTEEGSPRFEPLLEPYFNISESRFYTGPTGMDLVHMDRVLDLGQASWCNDNIRSE